MTTIAERLGSGGLGAFTPLLFLPGLMFASHSLRLALPGAGLPLRAGAHVAVQAAALGLIWGQGQGVCRALLGSGRGGPAERLVRGWYSVFSVLEAPLPLPLDPPEHCDQSLARCCVLVAFFQLTIGFLLPVALVLASEARAYRAHCCSCSLAAGRGGGGGSAAERAAERAALRAAAPAWWEGGRALQAALLSPFWAARGDVKLWGHLAVLALAWVVVAGLMLGCRAS